VFELGNGVQKVRFTYKLSLKEIEKLGEVNFVKGKFKKSLQFRYFSWSYPTEK